MNSLPNYEWRLCTYDDSEVSTIFLQQYGGKNTSAISQINVRTGSSNEKKYYRAHPNKP